MSVTVASESEIVAAQCGRVPRTPYRVAARCSWGYPMVIVSPPRLDDGTPFPNYAWLTCPWVARQVSDRESAGAIAEWQSQVDSDEILRVSLAETDARLREARAAECAEQDPCADVGVAGQRSAGAVKCLHARVALALVGILDPVGEAEMAALPAACQDCECDRYQEDSR